MRSLALCLAVTLFVTGPRAHGAGGSADPVSNATTVVASAGDKDKEQDKDKGKDKDKEKDKDDSNKGGAGVGPPTVHGCDGSGCGNNGPHEPTPPKKKCRKDKSGIEICE